MSKKLFKITCALLILSLTALAAVSCAEGPDDAGTPPPLANNGNVVGGNGDDPVGEEPEAEGVVQTYQMPNMDFGGQQIRLTSHDHTAWAWSSMIAEELTGEPINDAIYTRNSIVEEGLNVEIIEHHIGDPHTRARLAIMAGSDDFDVVFMNSYQAGPLAGQGIFLNLHYVPGLDLDAPWWNQNAHESAELLGRLFFTTSDAHLVTNDAIWVIYFNVRIQQDLQLANPYELVNSGQWTMDAFYNMARASAIDIDGDGQWTVADQWGFTSHNLAFLAFFIGQGQQLARRDADNEPYLVMPDEIFINAFYNAHRLMNASQGLYLYAQGGFPGRTPDLDHATLTFMANMSLFATETLSHARVFREMDADFGLLPHPKFNEHQANYYTLMIDTVPVFAIPVTVGDPERIGIFMDAFTGVSADVLMPAYYEASLIGRFTRSDESIEMLDIIRERRVFDLMVLYNWASFYGAFITHGVAQPSPVSLYDRHSERVTMAIQRTLDMFLDLD